MDCCPANTDEEFKTARAQALDDLLASDSRLKVLIAGPGTGKTYSFSKLIDQTEGRTLVISFLGNLVQDLKESLGNRSQVCTFHSFCKHQLHRLNIDGITHDFDYYPPLLALVDVDLGLLREEYVSGSIERAYVSLDDSTGLIADAIAVGNYYDAVGHVDSVYRVYDIFRSKPEAVPTYAQVLVDEYQDFNLLEVSLIAQLTRTTRAVVAGDDDQALYGFKQASARYLQELVTSVDYERFDLPYCSRCTAVLVDAIHRVVERAQAAGLLMNRIEKPYWCYLPEKRRESTQYPTIVDAHCSVETNRASYMCRYVEQQIQQRVTRIDVERSLKGRYPTVLIIAPVEFGRRVYEYLSDKGLPNVKLKTSAVCEVGLIDGYLRISSDEHSRLGWRILTHLLKPPGWKTAVKKALVTGDELRDLLDEGFVSNQLQISHAVGRLVSGETLTKDDTKLVECALGASTADLRLPEANATQELKEECDAVEGVTTADDGHPTVWVTSLVGAKGLQAEHVFVVGLNDHHFPHSNSQVTEAEVCALLVALTRARQSCTLVSCGRFGNHPVGRSIFLGWIRPLLHYVRVDASYWQSA